MQNFGGRNKEYYGIFVASTHALTTIVIMQKSCNFSESK